MKRLHPGFLLGLLTLALLPLLAHAGELPLYFTPEWREKAVQAKEIADALARDSGLEIRPRVVASNADLMGVFARKEPAIVYVGSLVTAILQQRGLATPVAQGVTGREMYTSIMIVPTSAGDHAETIAKEAGTAISFAKGASSGELGAKAASGGLANLAAPNHPSAVNAVKAGRAKAAFVKNWWWLDNRDKYPECKSLEYPGVSNLRNPDHVLSVSQAVAANDTAKITQAAMANATVFKVSSFRAFDPGSLQDTLELMRKAGLDPITYSW